MIFSTELADKVAINESGNNKKYLEAGIHENVKFSSVRTAVSPTGKNFIEFTFEKDGKELIHTEWEPAEKEDNTVEQNQNKATNQVTRISRILRCFYSKEAITFAGNSYKEYTNWVCSLLNKANKDTLLKVKIVYNDKGYTTLPSYVSYVAIEPMNIPENYYKNEDGTFSNESKITKLGIDQFVKPVIADKETKDDNPLASTPTPAVADELPF